MKINFQHLRDTKNVGDRWCSPFDWFEWPSDVSASDIRQPSAPYDIGVYGGGKIFGALSGYAGVSNRPGTLHIAWGVSTVQSFPISVRYARSRNLCQLVGTRDWGEKGYTWAPCASCMAPNFDDPPEPEHDVVFYFHGGKTAKQKIKIPASMPSMSNNVDTLDNALSFIASGRTVVSNSYHGVYWALLMGKRALCVPFSKKFSKYRYAPGYAKPSNWLKSLDQAVAQPAYLESAREATHSFHYLVRNKIEQKTAL